MRTTTVLILLLHLFNCNFICADQLFKTGDSNADLVFKKRDVLNVLNDSISDVNEKSQINQTSTTKSSDFNAIFVKKISTTNQSINRNESDRIESLNDYVYGNSTDYDESNSTLDFDYGDHNETLFEIDPDQYLIDGYRTVKDENQLFLMEEFVKRLNERGKMTVNVSLHCLKDNCADQKFLLITANRLVFQYELIRQNIFLDKTAKYHDYLNCFFIQYNPNFGLRSYLRNGFTFNFKKAFINDCFDDDHLVGKIYLTNEFSPILKKQNLMSNVLQIRYDKESLEYELVLDQEDRKSTKDQEIINNLKNIYPTYVQHLNSGYLNESCSNENEYYDVFKKVLNYKLNKRDRINFLNDLNSSLFHDGLHQKLNKFKFLKAQLIIDSGLLEYSMKGKYKVMNHLFQIIYETQNHFKQLNMYLVIVRLRFKMPNDLNIYSNTDLRMNITELYDKFKYSNDDTYFDLESEFKILFTSFKFYHQTSTNYIPSYSSDNLISKQNSVIIIDLSYLKTNHWLLTYEIGHLLGLKDDDESICKCLSEHCLMNLAIKTDYELTWSQCSLKQLENNLKLFKFNLDLPVDRTEFATDFFNHSICGNGVLERGELCDCGQFGCFFFNESGQTYQQNTCCNSTNCRLINPNNDCALGSCCDLSNCKYRSYKHVCRPSQDICDIEETCEGYSAFCPEDDYYVNGEFCGLDR